MEECVFCRIAEKKVPAKIVYEDESLLAFHDINPQAPVHILIIPKKHIGTLLDVPDEDIPALGNILSVARDLAYKKGIAEKGFRIVTNCNPESGQTVYHLHFHLLGGRYMTWPPG